jgi:hypothetical protein
VCTSLPTTAGITSNVEGKNLDVNRKLAGGKNQGAVVMMMHRTLNKTSRELERDGKSESMKNIAAVDKHSD